jgi:hypothetical protein
MDVEAIFKHDSNVSFSFSRKKEDYVKIDPSPGSYTNLNKNGEILFEVYNQQSFLYLPESFFVINFEITKTDGTALGADNITLEHNFFPRLFSQMRLNVGAKNLEEIQHPGEADTLLKSVTMPYSYSRCYGDLTGWIPDEKSNIGESNGVLRRAALYNKSKKFESRWFLKPLIGFTDYMKILWGLKLSFSLQRYVNDENIFWGDAGTNAKIKINSIRWWIPQISPSLEVETMVTKRLAQNKPLPAVYLKRTLFSLDIEPAQYDWRIGAISNNPRYIIFGFKRNDPSFEKNNSRFISYEKKKEIKSLRLALNQTYYPLDKMEFSAINSELQHPYGEYIQMCKTFMVDPQYDFSMYKKQYSIFCFDVSSQPEDLKKNGIDITLKIEKSPAFTLHAFCLLLEDVKYSITVNDGQMIRID